MNELTNIIDKIIKIDVERNISFLCQCVEFKNNINGVCKRARLSVFTVNISAAILKRRIVEKNLQLKRSDGCVLIPEVISLNDKFNKYQ